MRKVSRIEHYPVSQRVQVHIDGKFLADSIQAIELSETGYPPRHYFPCKDVRMDLLTLSETTARCPFKGKRVYFSLGDNKDIAWSYEQPIKGMEAIAGRVAFGEKAKLVEALSS